MPYRSEHDTREARREALALALAQVRDDRANERGAERDLDGEERRLQRAIRELGLPRKRASLPVVAWDRLRIASPCTEDWDAMIGDARVRHCSQCERDVFDLSAMSRAEIAASGADAGASPCVRLYLRRDGNVLTPDGGPTSPQTQARRAVAAVACAVTAVGGLAAHEALENQRHSAQVPARSTHHFSSSPRDDGGSHLMGRMPAPRSGSGAYEALPPWERPDIIARGARDLAALSGIDPEQDDAYGEYGDLHAGND